MLEVHAQLPGAPSDGLSFDVGAGEIVGVAGLTGSGRSRLLRPRRARAGSGRSRDRRRDRRAAEGARRRWPPGSCWCRRTGSGSASCSQEHHRQPHAVGVVEVLVEGRAAAGAARQSGGAAGRPAWHQGGDTGSEERAPFRRQPAKVVLGRCLATEPRCCSSTSCAVSTSGPKPRSSRSSTSRRARRGRDRRVVGVRGPRRPDRPDHDHARRRHRRRAQRRRCRRGVGARRRHGRLS